MRALAALVLTCAFTQPAAAKKLDRTVEQIDKYKLGSRYEAMKDLPGFKLDPSRTKPAENIVAAKIIDQGVASTPTIQRFTFKAGKLIRVSIIFHPPEKWPEAAVKSWLVPQWGDTGPREKCDDTQCFLWQFATTIGVLVPADGNRWMASLYYDDAHE